jgi:hypothetical protein
MSVGRIQPALSTNSTRVSHARLERLLLASGAAYFILSGLAFSLVPPLPAPATPVAVIAAYFADHRSAFLANTFLNCLNQALFLWFLGGLRALLGRVEGGEQTLARVAYGSGVLGAAVLLVFTMLSGGLVYRAAGAGDPAVVRVFYDCFNVGFTLAGLPLASFLAAASALLIVRKMSAWLGWVGLLVALAQVVAAAGILIEAGPLALGSPFGFAAFLLFFVWVLIASVVFSRRRVWDQMTAG